MERVIFPKIRLIRVRAPGKMTIRCLVKVWWFTQTEPYANGVRCFHQECAEPISAGFVFLNVTTRAAAETLGKFGACEVHRSEFLERAKTLLERLWEAADRKSGERLVFRVESRHAFDPIDVILEEAGFHPKGRTARRQEHENQREALLERARPVLEFLKERGEIQSFEPISPMVIDTPVCFEIVLPGYVLTMFVIGNPARKKARLAANPDAKILLAMPEDGEEILVERIRELIK